MLDVLITWIVNAIHASGYLGVFFLMLLESALIPIPSEIIMPFSGYLVYLKSFGFFEVIIAGTLGNLAGSLLSYWIGLKGGRKIIEKYEKVFFFSKKDIDFAERWFRERGEITIFLSRLLPAIRTFVSLPAGVGKMDIKKFVVYTLIGSFVWSVFLCWVGIFLGSSWDSILGFFRQFDIVIIISAIVILVVYLWKFRK